MIVKAICKPDFGDITTGDKYENQVKRKYGEIFECDEELAQERIEKGLVVKANNKEIKEYKEKNKNVMISENHKKEETTENEIKLLDDCTLEELYEIVKNENIEILENDTKEEVINKIKQSRDNKLEQENISNK